MVEEGGPPVKLELRATAARVHSPFLEFLIGSAIADAVTGNDDGDQDAEENAANSWVDYLSHENGSGVGTINGDTLASIDDILREVERTESQQTLTSVATSLKTITEQRLVRTFTNPYRDRSLELRFSPVFRRFEVKTRLTGARLGILLRPGRMNFAVASARQKLGTFVRQRAIDPSVANAAALDPGIEDEIHAIRRTSFLTEHLDAHAAFYTRRFLEYTMD